MHLFTSTLGVSPGYAGEALGQATAAARRATQAVGRPVSAWINVYGAPPDSITFAACVDSPADVAEALAAFDTHDAVPALAGKRSDAVYEVVADSGACGAPPLFADVSTARYDASRIAAATVGAVGAADEIGLRTGLRTIVVYGCRGRSATLARLTFGDALADLDAVEPGDVPAHVVPGSIDRRLVRRLR